MHDKEMDPDRRKLLAATISVGGVGTVAAIVPFVESMSPSEAAKAAGAPVEFDVTNIAPGKLQTVEWRGKPVWIVHRTEAMLAQLDKHDNLLADPQSKEQQQPKWSSPHFNRTSCFRNA